MQLPDSDIVSQVCLIVSQIHITQNKLSDLIKSTENDAELQGVKWINRRMV